ncbi:MAG: hypothetical protein DPW09_23815 [Anaerolineae bacterium]|nr:LysM peptidoglycan-binding domain-containing protein [Anaerolineales bacterium]MCQ3976470.1 hypothetical protein [Anaerolineae bacterium]
MLTRSTALKLMILCGLLLGGAVDPAQAQSPNGAEYTVQAGDWLSKIAEKYFGDAGAYPTIIEATNARAGQDNSFAAITDANLIEVGQKLWIPGIQGENTITAGSLSFQPVEIEALGLRAVVPQNWPEVESTDPLFAHAWSAGLFSVVNFTTLPGNDPLVGVARGLGVPPEALSGSSLGGQLITDQIGGRAWAIYTRDEGGRAAITAATAEQKVIYQVNIFSESSQAETIVRTVLENFEIVDPLAAQQVITIQSPAAGITLTNPFELRGATSQYPFRGSLVYRVLDASGNQVGRGPFEVVGRLGGSATFAVQATYLASADGPGTVEVAELSTADGTIITIDSVAVQLVADPPGYTVTIDDPAPYASIASPVEVRGKTSNKPYESNLNYRIFNAAGQQISQGVFQVVGEAGQVNAFGGFVQFVVQEDGPGRVEVYDLRPEDGSTFAIGSVNVWLTKPR